MAENIMIHSFRRGVGRTFLTANLAAAMAAQGLRIGLIDTDLELPELHLAFQFNSNQSGSLNDVLWNDTTVENAVVDVSTAISPTGGKLYLLPARSQPEAINAARRTPLQIEKFSQVLDEFTEKYALDYVLMDISAGLDEQTMSLLALSDVLLVMLRLDQQEYQGTALLVEIGNRLNIPKVLVVTNEVGDNLDQTSILDEVRRVFHSECVAILPHSEALPLLGKEHLLVRSQPENPVSVEISRLARILAK